MNYTKILTGTPVELEETLNKHLEGDWIMAGQGKLISVSPGILAILLIFVNKEYSDGR